MTLLNTFHDSGLLNPSWDTEMMPIVKQTAGTILLAIVSSFMAVSHAQPLAPGNTATSFSLTGINQFSTGLDQGGNFNWYEADARLRMTRQFSSEWAAGFSVGYGSTAGSGMMPRHLADKPHGTASAPPPLD